MKNRDWLMKLSLIDLLHEANGRESPLAQVCIIDKLEGNEQPTECRSLECYECLCEWLNEEKAHK